MSVDYSKLEPGMVLNITPNTNLLADEYKSVRLVATAGYEIASVYRNVEGLHANIYSSLPQGTIKDARELKYLIVSSTNGGTVGGTATTAIATAWIESYDIVTVNAFVVDVASGPVDAEKIISEALQSRGITDFTIRRK